MGLQTTVNINPALGVPGSQAAFLGEVTTVHQYLSDGTAAAGSFAFESAATVNTSGSAVGGGVVGNTNSSATAALGLVVRLVDSAIPDGVDGSLVYPQGFNVTVAIRGDFFVAATGAAAVGASVYVDPATGAMAYVSASGLIDTGWKVATAATAAGDIIVISNHG